MMRGGKHECHGMSHLMGTHSRAGLCQPERVIERLTEPFHWLHSTQISVSAVHGCLDKTAQFLSFTRIQMFYSKLQMSTKMEAPEEISGGHHVIQNNHTENVNVCKILTNLFCSVVRMFLGK